MSKYLNGLYELLVQKRNGGNIDWNDIANFEYRYTGNLEHIDTCRKGSKYFYKFLDAGWIKEQGEIPCAKEKISIEIKSNGDIISERLVKLTEKEVIDPKTLMDVHGYDSNKFTLVSSRASLRSAGGANEKPIFTSSISVKPNKGSLITFEDIEEYYKNKIFFKNKPDTNPCQYSIDGEILEIALPDLHLGALAHCDETGFENNIEIAVKNYWLCFNDILSRCKYRKFKKIVFVTLGDFLHIDNLNNTTTGNTPQCVDGRATKIVKYANDILIDSITVLGNIAPTEVIYISGNHDRFSGYMLIQGVANAFLKDKNITFDVLPNPQKYRRFGKSLIGWSHGDMPRKNVSNFIYDAAREDFGKSKYIEIHMGHYHSEQTSTDDKGIVIKYLPSLAFPTAWEHANGYSFGVKSIISHVWNEEKGLRDVWYSNL